MHKRLLGPLILVATVATGPQSAVAQNYPWCRMHAQTGAASCTFVSRDQCMQSTGGNTGFCYANPAFTSSPAPARGSRRPNG
jgi:hypothetical protein